MMDKIKVFIVQHFQTGDEDFEAWLDWWYQDESTDEWDDELEFGGLLWQRSLTSRQQLRQAKYIGQMKGDNLQPARMAFTIIEQNPNAAANKGRRPSEGQQLLEEGNDVAQVIIDGDYVGMIVNGNFHFYPGKGI
jgi:hypothetical protein